MSDEADHTVGRSHPSPVQWAPVPGVSVYGLSRLALADTDGHLYRLMTGGQQAEYFWAPNKYAQASTLTTVLTNVLANSGSGQPGPGMGQVLAMLNTINTGVSLMSGSVANITTELAEMQAAVDAVSGNVDKAVVFINSVPALVQAAIDAALASAPLTAEQMAAFNSMQAMLDTKGAEVVAALPAVTPPDEPPAPTP